MIAFHKPYFPEETRNIQGLSVNQYMETKTIEVSHIFRQTPYETYHHKMLLTHSASASLEMMALLLSLKAGDEVIMPSFTYVATANAFERVGVKVVFADISEDDLNIDLKSVETLITPRTKGIIPIHYGGIAADLPGLKALCGKGIHLIEDGAHTIGATYGGVPLGYHGTLGCISFHETKNIHALGSGGALMVNDPDLLNTAYEIMDQGTNRRAFINREVTKYKWQRLGSAFEMGHVNKWFLKESMAHLEPVTLIRNQIWARYHEAFQSLEARGRIGLAKVRKHANGNGHIFYILAQNHQDQKAVLSNLKAKGIDARTHYEPLHRSEYYKKAYGQTYSEDEKRLIKTEELADRLIRLPIYDSLTEGEQSYIIECVKTYFK